MSPVAKARGSTRKRRRRKQSKLASWWPLLLALLITPFAVRAASLLALSGPQALRLLFPFVALLQAHAPRSFALEQRDTLAEWGMWAQLPAYGVLASLFARWRGTLAAFAGVLALHLLAVGAAMLTGKLGHG